MNTSPLAGTAACLLLALLAAREAGAEPESSGTGLELTVSEQGPDQPWQVEVKNRSNHLVRLVADLRLLWFEVKVPGKRTREICRLPEELLPASSDDETSVWLRPGDRVESGFDPRLFCFSGRGQSVLVPGAVVFPRFGWPIKKRRVWSKGRHVELAEPSLPPFVAWIGPQEPGIDPVSEQGSGPPGEPVKLLEGEPVGLGSRYARWSRTGIEPPANQTDPLELVVSEGSDTEHALGATVTLFLRNRSQQTRYIFFRRELVSFEVMGLGGPTRCDPEPDQRAPDREAFLTLKPGASMSFESRLIELCPRSTFALPGLYLIHARLDATETGKEYGLDAFVGRLVTKRPVALRIRRGDGGPRPLRLRLVPGSALPNQ